MLQRVQELQQKAAIEVHRAGHVTERHELRPAKPTLAAGELDRVAAGLERQSHRSAKVDTSALPGVRGLPPATLARIQSSRDLSRDTLDLFELARTEAREVPCRACRAGAR